MTAMLRAKSGKAKHDADTTTPDDTMTLQAVPLPRDDPETIPPNLYIYCNDNGMGDGE